MGDEEDWWDAPDEEHDWPEDEDGTDFGEQGNGYSVQRFVRHITPHSHASSVELNNSFFCFVGGDCFWMMLKRLDWLNC